MMLVDLLLAALALGLSNIIHYGDLLTLGAYLGSAGMRLTTFMLLAVETNLKWVLLNGLF